MVIVKIIGGLGNQMFQYAYAKTLEIQGYDVQIDSSAFKNYKLHNYGLDSYNIDINIFINNNLFIKIFNKLRLNRNKIIKEKSLLFDENLLKIKDGSYIEGYFQCEKYFLNIRDELIESFIINSKLSIYTKQIEKEILKDKSSCSLHIRRGDYVSDEKSNNIHGVCSLDYYNKAIELMRNKFISISFYIFSDDIAWVKENLKVENAIYIDSEEKRIPNEDIYLMSLCTYNIIANSSFSWWGAWLNTNPNKMVIAPSRWFSDKSKEKESMDIIPSSWVRI